MMLLRAQPQRIAAIPSFTARDVDHLGYGLHLLFTTFPLAQVGMPARQLGYFFFFFFFNLLDS